MSSISHHYIMSGMIYGFPFVQVSLCKSFVKTGKLKMLQGIIMPHPPIARELVGRGEEKKIQTTLDAYRAASRQIAEYAPETIVIISPHNVFFRDAFYISPGETYTDSLVRWFTYPAFVCE